MALQEPHSRQGYAGGDQNHLREEINAIEEILKKGIDSKEK